MAPTAARSSSQSKISDTFRSGTKNTKPLKQTKPSPVAAAVKPVTKPAPISTLPAEKKDGKHLNASDPNLVNAARKIESNRQTPFVHKESQSTIHTIMRNFDLTPKFGPCVGISRLDRYRRAEKMGMKPPVEVLRILETEEGLRDWNNDLFSQTSALVAPGAKYQGEEYQRAGV